MPDTNTGSRMPVSTPVKQGAKPAAPIVDSPGTWRHPRLNEISRRRDATTFSEKNLRRITYNVGYILLLWTLQVLVRRATGSSVVLTGWIRAALGWTYFIIQSIPVANIGLALLPLFRATDKFEDIPLSAAQRQLLGLEPSTTVETPNAVYSTPPRYSRTPSQAGSVASKASYTSSPLSGRGSPAMGSNPLSTANRFSPANSPSRFGGPLGASSRRSSFGSPTALPNLSPAGLGAEPATPSPSAGKRTSVGLNNKWLYEKGRRSSGTWMN